MSSLSHTITSVIDMQPKTGLDERPSPAITPAITPVVSPVVLRRSVNTTTNSRADWRNSRYATAQHASSRVSYTEDRLTAAQLREAD